MRNTGPRAVLMGAVIVFLSQFSSFLEHAAFFLSGEVSRALIRDNWGLVVVNVVLFVSFIALLRYRRSIDWSERAGYGIYGAFILSLFVEMYGLPLTIFLGSGIIAGPAQPPAYLFSIQFLGTELAMNAWMLAGVGITVLGMVIVAAGWYQVYTADGLVKNGLYRYSRNPQYVGIILIAAGWVIGWPTVLTLALFPFVFGAYTYLAYREASDMRERYPAYEAYADRVPALL